jgi:hypothetical protein
MQKRQSKRWGQQGLVEFVIGRAGIPTLPLMVFLCSLCASAQVQQPRSPGLPVPPPMTFISREERAQLDATKDPKAHTRTAIDLAGERLARAEQFTSQKKYVAASQELGCYLALIDDTMQFLAGMDPDKAKTRDLYRHLDIALRSHIPRLAVMRRSTPAEYAVEIKSAEEHARETRTEALESFYGRTVLRESSGSGKKTEKPAAKDATSAQDPKRP